MTQTKPLVFFWYYLRLVSKMKQGRVVIKNNYNYRQRVIVPVKLLNSTDETSKVSANEFLADQ